MSKLATIRSGNDLPAQIAAGTEPVSNPWIRLGTIIARAIAVVALTLFGAVVLVSAVATLIVWFS